ncbi:cilia- and flagella-associated protein 99 [Nelusetta ayraudi]|uniref:cilia- and flagella-associated protein 99 n=1 Tax=Nelusetta ayraudi TaxID=303726 RepID=UPI003F715595
MASNYGQLVKKAIVLLEKFHSGLQCSDDFMIDASMDLQNMNSVHRQFVLDIVSGCIEHNKLLDIVVSVFCRQSGKYFIRDRTRFVVICYLIIFAHEDLELDCFGNIVTSLGIKKMEIFLTFFFTHLNTWIQGEWNKIYDAAYVERVWIEPLLRWRPKIDNLMDRLAVTMTYQNELKKAPAKTTAPKEFSLTQPKPPAVPLPELIPLQEKWKPVPSSTYRAPKEIQMIEECKEKNQLTAEELLYEASVTPFKCLNTEKSEHTKRAISQIKADFESKLKFNTIYSSGTPSTKRAVSLPAKMNRAFILRHGGLYDRQLEEEMQRYELLMEGAQEPTAFLQWQREMREKDLQDEQTRIERRHLEGLMSHKEAAIAPARMMERNQKAAQLQKEEAVRQMQRYAERRMQEDKEMRELVQQVAEGHKNSKTVQEKLRKMKQNIVREVSEQNRELLRLALEEAHAELTKKFQIIKEIHAVESLPHIQMRTFDDTETAGHGLLGEMSLFELKERLAHLREAQRQDQQEKRERILMDKERNEKLLLEKQEAINLQKRAQAHLTALRKEKKDKQQMVAKDETILALQKKLEEKEQEYQRLKQSARKRAKASAARTARKRESNKEEEAWKESELHVEHQIQNGLV